MSDSGGHSDSPKPPRQFATTQWSLVADAGRGSSPDSRAALEALCQAYWYPLYAYARRHVARSGEAEDLTQAFFAELLEKNYVADAQPDRGRFRAFLLTAFKHFLSKQRDKSRAAKRGGGRHQLSLDFQAGDSRYRLEPVAELTPEQAYDRQWALTLLGHTLERLANEYAATSRERQFELLKPYLGGDRGGVPYAETAQQLDCSEAAVKMAVQRLRRRYRELIRAEIAATVASPDEIDDEIGRLFAALGRR
jgi:RNA polymerase sigma-70 factor (ECF subfamily)